MSAESGSGQRNQSLDLLRGIAILMVIAAHCELVAGSVVPGLAAAANRIGEFGVQLFFIISGYTMMLTFGDKIDSAAVRAFYIRRMFRIVPLFWIACLFYLLLTRGQGFREWAPHGVGASDILLNFLFLQWTSATAFNSIVPGGWSIGVEMQFYCLFPLLIWLFRCRGGPISVYALIALIGVAADIAAEHYLIQRMKASLPPDSGHLAVAFFYCWLPRQLVCFGFGMLLHDYFENRRLPVVGALFLIAACLLITGGGAFSMMFRLALIVLKVGAKLPAVALFGRHSYGIYLGHFAVVWLLLPLGHIDLTVLFGLVAGGSLALSCFLIEPMIGGPFNRLGHVLASGSGRGRNVPGMA